MLKEIIFSFKTFWGKKGVVGCWKETIIFLFEFCFFGFFCVKWWSGTRIMKPENVIEYTTEIVRNMVRDIFSKKSNNKDEFMRSCGKTAAATKIVQIR